MKTPYLATVLFLSLIHLAALAAEDVTLTGNVTADKAVISSANVTTSGTVAVTSAAKLTIKAQNTVKLQPGFSVASGSRLSVKIGTPELAVTPNNNPTVVWVGGTQQFTITATGCDGAVYGVTWNATGGTINGTGLYTAGTTPGEYSVSASAGGITSPSVNVTVNGPTTLVVSPSQTNVLAGHKVRFRAGLRDFFDDALPLPTASLSWSTTGAGNDINTHPDAAPGLFTAGTVPGIYTVTGTCGTPSGQATVIVQPLNIDAATDVDASVAMTLCPTKETGQTVEIVTGEGKGPFNGVLSGTPPNVTYYPNSQWNGVDTFEFKVMEGETNCGTAIATVAVGKPLFTALCPESGSWQKTNQPAISATILGNNINMDSLGVCRTNGQAVP
jgi:hypothetical protein